MSIEKFLSSIIVDGTISKVNGTNLQYLMADGSTSTSPSTFGYVPYTGATTNVNLGIYGITSDYTQFNTTNTQVNAVGKLKWNDSDGTLDLGLKGGNVTLQIGQETVLRIVNKTATNITLSEANYQAVIITGAQGQRPKVDLAKADSEITSGTTIGIVTETILINQEGYINTSGTVREINTTGSLQGETWADGDVLYLSGTVAGQITNIKPIAPIHLVAMGYVLYAHAIHGTIFVKVQNGYELDELHNVSAIAPNNNEVLTYDTATLLWKPKTVATALGYTPANDTSVVHLSGTETITGIKTFNTQVQFGLNSYISKSSSIGMNPPYVSFSVGTDGAIFGESIAIKNGQSTDFLKADGSIDSNTYAIDSGVVHLTGNEIINGVKSFTVDSVSNTGRLFLTNNYLGASSPSSSPLTIYQNGASGTYGEYIMLSNDGTGILLDSQSSSGNLIEFRKDGGYTGIIDSFANITMNSFIKSEGTASQFLKADGTIDSNTYALSSDLSSYQPILTNPITGPASGTTNTLTKFTGPNAIGDSSISDTGTLVTINNTLSVTGLQTFKGTIGSDSSQLGAELLTTGSGTSWTGYSYISGYTIPAGWSTPLTSSFTPTIGITYNMSFSLSNAAGYTWSLGGVSGTSGGTGVSATIVATTTAPLVITLSGTTLATLLIASVKAYSITVATTTWLDSGGNISNELRASFSNTNLFFGTNAGYKNSTGDNNVAIGKNALYNNFTGTFNTSIGVNSLIKNISGGSNTAIGTQAVNNNTSGSYNVGIGTNTLYGNTIGTYNSGLGVNAGGSNVSGNYNTFIGGLSGYYLTNKSTAITTLNNSVMVGYNTSPLGDNQSNQIVIGYNANGLGSNTTILGNSSTTTAGIWGRLLIGTSTLPSNDGINHLQIGGYAIATGYRIPLGAPNQFLMADGSTSTAGGGATNLSVTSTSNSLIVNSDTGTDATIPLASTTVAGIIGSGVQTFAGSKTFSNETYFDSEGISIFDNPNGSYGRISISDGTFTCADVATGNVNFTVSYGTLSLFKTNTILASIVQTAITASRTYTLPDETGTLAISENTVNLIGNQTINGIKTIVNPSSGGSKINLTNSSSSIESVLNISNYSTVGYGLSIQTGTGSGTSTGLVLNAYTVGTGAKFTSTAAHTGNLFVLNSLTGSVGKSFIIQTDGIDKFAIDNLGIRTSFAVNLDASSTPATNPNEPTTPAAGYIKTYTKLIANKAVSKVKGPTGVDMILQNSLWDNNVTIWNNTNATAGSWIGTVGAGAGTFTQALPTTTSLYTTIKRARYANVITTANQVLGQRNTEAMFFRGGATGQGGFFFYARLGFDTWTNGGRFFAGMHSGTTVVSADPSSLNNTVGFAVDAADNGTISFLTRGTVATKASTGYTIVSGKGYDVYMYCSPFSNKIYWKIEDINAGTETNGEATVNLPTTTTMLTAGVLASNAALTPATSIQLGVNKIYIETDF